MTYIETFSDARSPPRRTFTSIKEAYIDLRQFASFSNVSVSIWKYREIEPKYYNGRIFRYGPKYNTAITNKLFFDIDVIDKNGNINEDILNGFYKLYKWVNYNEFKREITFTGGGFQLVFSANTTPNNYSGVYYYLKNKFGIKDNEFPSLEKMRRVPGSFNFGKEKKSQRLRYCISLKDSEVFIPFEDIMEIAEKPRSKVYKMGYSVYTPNIKGSGVREYKLNRHSDFTPDAAVDDILNSYGWSYDDICPYIKDLIEQKNVGHYDRINIIKYLKSILNIKYGDMLILLPKLLTGDHGPMNDGEHSIFEGQPASIYKRGVEFYPKVLKDAGKCDPNCDKCEVYLKNKWRLK